MRPGVRDSPAVSLRGLNLDTNRPALQPAGATGSDRTAVSSRGYGEQASLSVGGEGQASLDVLAREIRKIRQDLGLGHSSRQVVKHVGDPDAHSPDAGFAAAFACFNRDDLPVVHGLRLGLARSSRASAGSAGRTTT